MEVKRFLRSNITNLKGINDRGYAQNAAKMELMIRGGSTQKLAEDLSVKRGANYRFKVKNVDTNNLSVMMVPTRVEVPKVNHKK